MFGDGVVSMRHFHTNNNNSAAFHFYFWAFMPDWRLVAPLTSSLFRLLVTFDTFCTLHYLFTLLCYPVFLFSSTPWQYVVPSFACLPSTSPTVPDMRGAAGGPHFCLFRIAASSIPFPILDVLLTSFDCQVICTYHYSGWPSVMECPP